jgi:hypothetical protein
MSSLHFPSTRPFFGLRNRRMALFSFFSSDLFVISTWSSHSAPALSLIPFFSSHLHAVFLHFVISSLP